MENNKSLEGAGGTFYVPPVIYLGTKMKLYYRRPYVRVKHKQIDMNIIYSKYSNRIAILSNDELDFFDALVSNDELDEFKYEEYLSFHVELIDSTIDKLIRNYIVFLTEEEFLENDFSKKTQYVKGIDTVYIHPTMRCNLNCSYCYNKAVVGLLKEMSVSSWSNAIDKLVSIGLKNVVITGGEPTLYRELEELVDCLKQRNLHVTIITNGTHMDRVIPLLNQIDCLIVSLDSYISTTNGQTRIGADAYDVYSNILNIKEHKDKIIINAVVTKNNYEQLDEFQKKSRVNWDAFKANEIYCYLH